MVFDDDRLPEGVERIRAKNPGPLTLSGTNTYLIGEPAYVIDPGPPDADHLERVWAAAERRGGVAAILLTHRHLDHAGCALELRERSGASLASAPQQLALGVFGEPEVGELPVDVELAEGERLGPFEVWATPGHAADHLSFQSGEVLFCGDTVLGEGSVFIPPGGGSMGAYLASLEKLRGLALEALCPGHGPVVWDPQAKLREYLDHRLDRERRLVAALDRGLRARAAILDEVWDDVPAPLRPAASLTLEAHLDKLEREQRLPAGVERL